MANVRYSNKLFIALSLQGHITANRIAVLRALMCRFSERESLHLQRRQAEFLCTGNSRILFTVTVLFRIHSFDL